MRTLAAGLHQLPGFPPHAINAYLVDDVLVDARTHSSRRRLLRSLEGLPVSTHVLTHAHPDHFGASHAVCEAFRIPLWCGDRDAEAVETASPQLPPGRIPALLKRTPMPPAHPVARRLREGDSVAGFIVLETPGHTPGHICLWRERDRTLIVGDVFFNLPRLRPPPAFLTVDRDLNRAAMRRLAALRPELVLFGHGPPLRDPDRLARVADV